MESQATTLITPQEAADLLGLHKQTVLRLVKKGAIKALKVGGSVRIDRSALLASGAASPETTTPSVSPGDAPKGVDKRRRWRKARPSA